MNTTTTEIPPRPKRSLFQLAADESAIADLLTSLDGDISDEETAQAIDQWLTENADALAGKLDAYLAIITACEASAALRKAEAKRLSELGRFDENRAERLKARLKDYMEATGKTQIETPHHRLNVVANGGQQSVRLKVLPAQLPIGYQRRKIEANVEAIRAELEISSALNEYAELLPRGTHLQVR